MERDEFESIFDLEAGQTAFVPDGVKVAHPSPGIDDKLFFDLETVPDWNAVKQVGIKPLELPKPTPIDDLPLISVNGTEAEIRKRYGGIKTPDLSWVEAAIQTEQQREKGPRKGVTKFFEEMHGWQQKAIEEVEGHIKNLSTQPETCRIVVFAYAVGYEDPTTCYCENEEDEKAAIDLFWRLSVGKQLVVYNGLSFDLPVLKVRSIRYGIPARRSFSTKPWDDDVIDVYKRRFIGWSPKDGFGKLKQLAQLMGMQVPAGEDSGSCVYQWFADGDREKLEFYGASDVEILRKLYLLYRGYFV